MMIRECDRFMDNCTKSLQCSEKSVRIADPAKRDYGFPGQFLDRQSIVSLKPAQARGFKTDLKSRLSDFHRLDIGVPVAIDPRVHKEPCPAQRRNRFPPQPGREHVLAVKRLRDIDKHNIEIACKRTMLKTVIKQQDFGVVSPDGVLGRARPVRIGKNGRTGKFHGDLPEFITNLKGISAVRCTRSDFKRPPPLPAISPAEDGDTFSEFFKPAQQVLDEGGFPRSPRGQITDRYYRNGGTIR